MVDEDQQDRDAAHAVEGWQVLPMWRRGGEGGRTENWRDLEGVCARGRVFDRAHPLPFGPARADPPGERCT